MSDVARTFAGTYGDDPAGVWAAPGRINLIGEHTDYNDGLVLPFALSASVYVAARLRTDGLIQMDSMQEDGGPHSIDIDSLSPGHPVGWVAYVAGVVWALDISGGLDLIVDGRVPAGSGLSSSAALECATALALNDLCELGRSRMDLARVAQHAENDFVGVPSGVMDQVASLLCSAGHALLFDVEAETTEQIPFEPSAAGLAVAVVDTRVSHQHAGGEYADRRRDCEIVANRLGVTSLRSLTTADLRSATAELQDDQLAGRLRHVVTENARVEATAIALRESDWRAVGDLMSASHQSLRDDYEVSCPELDVAVETALSAGAIGARMTGGGFGGSAIALIPLEHLGAFKDQVTGAFADSGFTAPVLFQAVPSDGAHRVA